MTGWVKSWRENGGNEHELKTGKSEKHAKGFTVKSYVVRAGNEQTSHSARRLF